MNSKVILHQVMDGDRWDLLAYRYYGTVYEMGRLIADNPHLPISEVLPRGAMVKIPVLTAKAVDDNDLPPWLQGGDGES